MGCIKQAEAQKHRALDQVAGKFYHFLYLLPFTSMQVKGIMLLCFTLPSSGSLNKDRGYKVSCED